MQELYIHGQRCGDVPGVEKQGIDSWLPSLNPQSVPIITSEFPDILTLASKYRIKEKNTK